MRTIEGGTRRNQFNDSVYRATTSSTEAVSFAFATLSRMKHLATVAGLALLSTCAFAVPKVAAPAKAPAKTALKTLNYCPVTGEELGAKTMGATTYKNYKIAFCCAGCPEAFAHLSAKDKDAKIAAIVAKQGKGNG